MMCIVIGFLPSHICPALWSTFFSISSFWNSWISVMAISLYICLEYLHNNTLTSYHIHYRDNMFQLRHTIHHIGVLSTCHIILTTHSCRCIMVMSASGGQCWLSVLLTACLSLNNNLLTMNASRQWQPVILNSIHPTSKTRRADGKFPFQLAWLSQV